jgi:hypothetical protein
MELLIVNLDLLAKRLGLVNSVRGYAFSCNELEMLAYRQRILTTWPIQISFFALVFMSFLSFCLTVILWANTFSDLSVPFLANR